MLFAHCFRWRVGDVCSGWRMLVPKVLTVHQNLTARTEMGCEANANGGCQTAESPKIIMTLERRTHTRTSLRVPIFLLPKDSPFPFERIQKTSASTVSFVPPNISFHPATALDSCCSCLQARQNRNPLLGSAFKAKQK